MSQFVLALDQGTTSSRAILFDAQGNLHAVAQREFPQHYPQPGWVEHDPEDIWASQISVAVEALSRAGLQPRDIAALGITNQRETTIVWNRKTGKPIYNAIVWQDRRTAPLCQRLRDQGLEPAIREKTGLLIDAYFSASKLMWLLDNVAGARAEATAGTLAFGTVDSWLLWKLTGGTLHAIDATNASRTMLFNIHTGAWDPALLEAMGIPPAILPEVRESSGRYADVSNSLGLAGIPITGVAGDQQAALFGQACYQPGEVKCTYGTGAFMLQTLGERPVVSQHRLLTTLAWKRNGRLAYALEGSVFIAGAVVQWLRDGLGLIRSSADVEALAQTEADSGGLYLVPAFAGLGAPHWDPHARGVMIGITRGTTPGHIARAALEAMAFQVADLLDTQRRDSGLPAHELRVDGGASRNDTLMQFQADLLGIPVVRPAVTETTALGASYLAGLAVGVWKGQDELRRHAKVERRFEPRMTEREVRRRRGRWSEALERAKAWYRPDEETVEAP